MYIIAGLGNPGIEYAKTRHNVGFLFIDYLYKEYDGDANAQIKIQRSKVQLVKPLTYMNLSGQAIKKAVNIVKAKNKTFDTGTELIIVHDDVDLEFGQIKIKDSGGDAGHNGIKNIIENLSTDRFIRVRIGVGRPSDKKISTADYVLNDFVKEEWNFMWEDSFPRVKRFINEYLLFGMQKARSLLHRSQS